jgi:predicted acyltransferase
MANSARVVSLDVSRAAGIMLVVASAVGFLGEEQAPNMALVDQIFPFFLFCMGLSIPFSHKSTKGKVIRTVAMFGIGFLLNVFTQMAYSQFPSFVLSVDFGTVRIMNVLQRIALCYFFCAVVLPRPRKSTLIALFLGYSLLLALDFGLPNQVDLLILKGHTYTPLGDPEGLLSTVGAICSTMFGQIIGDELKKHQGKLDVKSWMGFAVVCVPAALLLTTVVPSSKDVWSTSYVLYSTGWSILSFCALYYVLDIKRIGVRVAEAVGLLGASTILVYAVSWLVYRLEILNQSVLYVAAYLLLWVVVLNLLKIKVRL